MDRAEDYASVGFRGRVGWGERPAVVVVDVCRAYLEGGPFTDAEGRFEAARASAARVVEAARAAGTRWSSPRCVLAPGGVDAGWFAVKVPGLTAFEEGSEWGEFPASPAPRAGEVVVTKQYASAFFGTSLAATLNAQGVDTVVVLGFSTSGCVRATALDALQHGFRPIVVREACGDRDAATHDQNLFDLDAKYADVLSESDVVAHLDRSRPMSTTDLNAPDLSWLTHAIAGSEQAADMVMLRADAERQTRTVLVRFPDGWRRDAVGHQPAGEDMVLLSGALSISGLTAGGGRLPLRRAAGHPQRHLGRRRHPRRGVVRRSARGLGRRAGRRRRVALGHPALARDRRGAERPRRPGGGRVRPRRRRAVDRAAALGPCARRPAGAGARRPRRRTPLALSGQSSRQRSPATRVSTPKLQTYSGSMSSAATDRTRGNDSAGSSSSWVSSSSPRVSRLRSVPIISAR